MCRILARVIPGHKRIRATKPTPWPNAVHTFNGPDGKPCCHVEPLFKGVYRHGETQWEAVRRIAEENGYYAVLDEETGTVTYTKKPKVQLDVKLFLDGRVIDGILGSDGRA